ncbi:hypothetical protein GCK72_010614 [Caenorhabditis remanei]|uniref:Uncharacterized protein n=1 Tax=Caenorhabditis remanei TaxID=31234 RepID=A0A6A5H7I7_CAERE|nr:hypothetical protein GCK72_010614 [Caenorhabditis remanei]KAF1762352.1 hypothetical protein GCK72_010614 [Caenorhabditis remanei]
MTGCFWFYHASKVIGEAAFSLTESSLWSIALIIDPLTNVILDRTVSKQAVRQQNKTDMTSSVSTGKIPFGTLFP